MAFNLHSACQCFVCLGGGGGYLSGFSGFGFVCLFGCFSLFTFCYWYWQYQTWWWSADRTQNQVTISFCLSWLVSVVSWITVCCGGMPQWEPVLTYISITFRKLICTTGEAGECFVSMTDFYFMFDWTCEMKVRLNCSSGASLTSHHTLSGVPPLQWKWGQA